MLNLSIISGEIKNVETCLVFIGINHKITIQILQKQEKNKQIIFYRA